jgi:CubicO group peptidase (beta-lactamase class C family)
MKKVIQLVSYNFFLRIFVKLTKQVFLASVFCMAMFFPTGSAMADLPVTGYPVPELVIFDDLMQFYMGNNDLSAGILAISKDGRVVYQRGFGYAWNGTDPLPENTPMRLASVEKPHTAAVIRHLASYGVFSLSDFVFDVGQPLRVGQRALLDASSSSSPYWPYNGVFGTPNYLDDVTINDLLIHRGGWDRGQAPDPFGILYTIGNATGTYPASPPKRADIVRYMMTQPMQFDPSAPVECNKDPNGVCLYTPQPCYCDPYSNYGYMLLSLIIEQETGQPHTDMIRQYVSNPDIWVPSTEIFLGKDFRGQQNQREPLYVATGDDCRNLNDPYNIYFPWDDQFVPCPYGGLLMEKKTGEGSLVGSAAPLMMFMNHYHSGSGAPISGYVNARKNGGLNGTSTRIQQWDTEFSVAILFPKGGGHADTLMPQVYSLIDWAGGIDWESLKSIDGFWVDFNASSSGFGGHDDPFHNMNEALSDTTDGTKLRFKPGTSNWTGTISKRMMLNTPSGTAIIGQ